MKFDDIKLQFLLNKFFLLHFMAIKDVFISGGNKLLIKEFKLNNLAKNAAIVMIAKRGSGKSWICRSLVYNYRNIPVGIVISPTDRMNNFYGKFFPDTFIHYEYKSEIILKLLARQRMIIEKNKEKNKNNKKIDTRSFIIMDDCLSSKKTWMQDPPIKEFII